MLASFEKAAAGVWQLGLRASQSVRLTTLHSHDAHGGRVKLARKYLISGRVQGVGFRFFTERWANQLGLCGYVKNCWDGTVEAYATGDAAALEEFKSRLAEGPRSARVDNIQESDEQVNNRYRRFVVESDW
jgi:acylphosphatase